VLDSLGGECKRLLTRCAGCGIVPVVDETEKDPSKKHRHDIGLPDHGPHRTETVTRTIQGLMAVALVLSAVLLVYAFLAAGFEISAP